MGGKKSRHSYCIGLGNVCTSVTESTEFPPREIKTVQPCFLWCPNYSIRSLWGNKACYRSGNIFSTGLLIPVVMLCYFFCFGSTAHCPSFADGTVPRCLLPRRRTVLLRRRPASSGPRSAELRVKTTSTVFCEAFQKEAINLLRKQLCKTSLFI